MAEPILSHSHIYASLEVSNEKCTKKESIWEPTNRSCSDDLPAKQLFFILFIATSEPRHFPW